MAERDVLGVLPEIDGIADDTLRAGVVATWAAAWDRSGLGPRILEIPFSIEAPDEPLIAHVRAVSAVAEVLADIVERRGRPAFDRELLRTATLLHDVDKVLMLEPDDHRGWRKTAAVRRIGHAVFGGMLCQEHGLPEPVVHLVLTHAVSSPLPPEPFEGVLLHYADFFAADTALFDVGAALLMHR
jgi:putative nucleotidyltransferase with HDIG domain